MTTKDHQRIIEYAIALSGDDRYSDKVVFFFLSIPVMKLTFEINPTYDAKMILRMLMEKDWKYRAENMGFDLKLAEKVHDANNKKQIEAYENQIYHIVEKTYKNILPYMEKSKDLYQRSWDEIIDEFSSTIAEITHPWFYKEYVCVITHFNRGISNWNGNVVGRWWRENPYIQRRITAHEVLLAHYFSIHRNLYRESGLSDRKIWALAEIAAFALTGLEKKIKKFWPWDTSGYYTDHNYPHIVNLQNKLQEPFLQRKNFREYIEKGIVLVRNYSVE